MCARAHASAIVRLRLTAQQQVPHITMSVFMVGPNRAAVYGFPYVCGAHAGPKIYRHHTRTARARRTRYTHKDNGVRVWLRVYGQREHFT